MAARRKSELSNARSGIVRSDAAIPAASGIPTPQVQRLSSHRKHVELVLQDLARERNDLAARLAQLKGQADAFERGVAAHLEDIEATLKIYETGLTTSVSHPG